MPYALCALLCGRHKMQGQTRAAGFLETHPNFNLSQWKYGRLRESEENRTRLYNDSGQLVKEIDFFGKSDQGDLKRVETVKAGLYWFVWINYYPESQLNDDGEVNTNYEHLFSPA